MAGRRWQVRQTIERMILNTSCNEYLGTCDKIAWFNGSACCKHHAGLLRRNTNALNAIDAFAGEASIQALINHGFSEKAILHYCRTILCMKSSMDEYVRNQVRLRQ